jgi:hypothetical protein
LNNDKSKYSLIKLNPNIDAKYISDHNIKLQSDISNIDKDIQSIQSDISDIDNLILSNQNMINSKELIIKSNNDYIFNKKNNMLKLIEQINQLNQIKLSKRIINIDDNLYDFDTNFESIIELKKTELKQLNLDLSAINKYLVSATIKNLLKSRDKIIFDYETLISSNTDLIYNSLNQLKISKYIKSEFDETIDIITDTLNIVLNKNQSEPSKHIVIKRYEQMNMKYEDYQHKLSDKEDLDICIEQTKQHIFESEQTSQISLAHWFG